MTGVITVTILACNFSSVLTDSESIAEDAVEPADSSIEEPQAGSEESSTEAEVEPAETTINPADLPANLLSPDDLVYMGAFRMPDRTGEGDGETWNYGGQALTYNPDGDPGGEQDGFPGSLFGTGHDIYNYVSEISIPAPVVSKELDQLPAATTIQGFQDVQGTLFTGLDEMQRVGLQYIRLPDETTGKLHLAMGQHHHDINSPSDTPSHAWLETDLSQQNTQGPWWIGDFSLYSVNGYMFEIPEDWANAYLGGMRIGTGRYRDGGWSGMGPGLIAYAPWLDGNPPAAGAHLSATALLLYSYVDGEGDFRLNSYHDSDQWEGGAWLTAGEKTAIIFAGTKGGGDYWWYGYSSPAGDGAPCPFIDPLDGTRCYSSDGGDCPPELSQTCSGYQDESKGWWSSRFDAQIIFYDPADMAAVVNGSMQPHEPQPYAVLDIDEHLLLNMDDVYIGSGEQRNYRIGEVAFDRERGFLYVFELFGGYDAKPVIHVWSVQE